MVITKPCSCSSSSFSPSALPDAPGFPPPIRRRRCPPLWSQPDLSFPVIRRCWYFRPDRQFHRTNCLGIGPLSLPSSSSISTSLVKLPRIRPKSALSLSATAAAAAKSLQSCPTLCDPIDGSPPGSPVPGSLQARTLQWAAISFSSG